MNVGKEKKKSEWRLKKKSFSVSGAACGGRGGRQQSQQNGERLGDHNNSFTDGLVYAHTHRLTHTCACRHT